MKLKDMRFAIKDDSIKGNCCWIESIVVNPYLGGSWTEPYELGYTMDYINGFGIYNLIEIYSLLQKIDSDRFKIYFINDNKLYRFDEEIIFKENIEEDK